MEIYNNPFKPVLSDNQVNRENTQTIKSALLLAGESTGLVPTRVLRVFVTLQFNHMAQNKVRKYFSISKDKVNKIMSIMPDKSYEDYYNAFNTILPALVSDMDDAFDNYRDLRFLRKYFSDNYICATIDDETLEVCTMQYNTTATLACYDITNSLKEQIISLMTANQTLLTELIKMNSILTEAGFCPSLRR